MTSRTDDDAVLFRTLFETAPDAVIVVDRGGNIVLANTQADRLFGHSHDGLIGLAIERLMPERLRAGHGLHRSRFMANPRSRPMGAGFELVGTRNDGSEFPIEIGLSQVRSGDDPLYAAAIRDITETQRARQALARARYDSVISDIGRLALESPAYETLLLRLPGIVHHELGIDAVGIFLLDPQRRDVQARASIGLSALLVERFRTLVEAAIREQRRSGQRHAAVDSGARTMAGASSLEDVARANGFNDSCVQILFDQSESAGALVALSTSDRAFDPDKLHVLQSIAHLLSAALQGSRSGEQLAHAQRLDAVGQLTGGVAHDFNNLLTVISGNLQLLEDELGADGTHAASIQSALRAVGNGAALTRKLLAFARRQRLSPRAIATAPWLAELTTLLRRTLGDTVSIRVDCAQSMPRVFADPAELDGALVNLALNARDAMPRGGDLSILVEERRIATHGEVADLDPGDFVAIQVRDTGMGMAGDVLARALEPFFTTKGAGKGSGLGLSMVYGFARQSGGAMTIESELGYGTRVTLFLPATPAAVGDAPAPEERASNVRGSERVLVVEDEPDVRHIAVAFLSSLGYRTNVAGTAAAALDLLRQLPDIDLLFTDVALGSGMNGFDLAEQARRLRPDLPVLLTSGYEHAANPADSRSEFLLLRKPYTRKEFSESIRQAIDRG